MPFYSSVYYMVICMVFFTIDKTIGGWLRSEKAMSTIY